MKVESATILICTYNRAEMLRETLAAVQAMRLPQACRCEVVVVDNNSTDATAEVAADAASRASTALPVVYLREERQGKSFALNRGLAYSAADVLALTDDDVIPAPDWLERIVAGFREHDAMFVFGKVLPRWGCVPPPELLTEQAQAIWGPLAIVDYGDTPAEYVEESTGQRLPIGANLAFTRQALTTIGGWRTDLGKVNNTLISGEDHEIFVRLRRAKLYRGFYDPSLTVRHYVPPSRLTRRYFRQWFFWHGKTEALMLEELFYEVDLNRVPRIGGVPRFLYRQAGQQVFKWVRRLGTRDALSLFIEELRSLQYLGLIAEKWRQSLRGRPTPQRSTT
jgi:glycosyltransferase involved in cell wall biosynthesis